LIFLLALYGLFVKGCGRLLQEGGRELLLLAGCILYLVAVTLPQGCSARYRIPIIPLLAVGASAGFARGRKGSAEPES
jgi:hypothetical protein